MFRLPPHLSKGAHVEQRLRLRGEHLETRVLLTGVEFAANDPIESSDINGLLFPVDVDGDGDMDILGSAYSGAIAWYENGDGRGGFKPPKVITRDAFAPWSISAADVDGDGDPDVLSASSKGNPANPDRDDKIAWYENVDGQGQIGPQQIIGEEFGAFSVHAVDVDGDDDLDVLSAARFANTISWYENSDGAGSFGEQHVITTLVSEPRVVLGADLDGDGDNDVLSASWQDNKIAWYENMDGTGTFGPQQVISFLAFRPNRIRAADLDADGDLDVLSASFGDDEIAWYENTDAAGDFARQKIIAAGTDGANFLDAVDLDGDGDLDVLFSAFFDGMIGWNENTDGKADFGPTLVITDRLGGARAVNALDVDGDGDLDVIAASEDAANIEWFENLSPMSPRPGDSNADGLFNQLDIVVVLQGGKYLTGQPATFAEGDWNADGYFDQFDLVHALAAGTYLS